MSLVKQLPAGSARNKIEYLARKIEEMQGNGYPLTLPFMVGTSSVGASWPDPSHGLLDTTLLHPLFLNELEINQNGFGEYFHYGYEEWGNRYHYLAPLKAIPLIESPTEHPGRLVVNLALTANFSSVSVTEPLDIDVYLTEDSSGMIPDDHITTLTLFPDGNGKGMLSGQIMLHFSMHFGQYFEPEHPQCLYLKLPESMGAYQRNAFDFKGALTILNYIPPVLSSGISIDGPDDDFYDPVIG